MNVLSLFSGIGGLDLGLERAGMSVVGQVEIDPFCQRVLATHWPEVPRHDDVRTAVDWWLGRPRPPVHLVAGGYPCEPFSLAGCRAGVADERWGWPWFYDVVRALQPRYVVVENVAADRDAFGWMLGDLAASGYDAEWDCVPAAAVGAPHLRDRLFVVADRPREGRHDRDGLHEAAAQRPAPARIFVTEPAQSDWWAAEPSMDRVVHGLPGRVDRVAALGRAVVPQVAEYIGRLIVGAEAVSVP